MDFITRSLFICKPGCRAELLREGEKQYRRRGRPAGEQRSLHLSFEVCVWDRAERESLACLSHLLQLLGGCLAHALFPIPACAPRVALEHL